ncbi:SIS domain-containing protein [Planococcus sp. CP5-4]|uniref:SIS domain-containing protein n=1 Tax=unclassified Planococcus (in: firmicutes) TaxID=2662419 RepID=UPI001C236186|nr:MULTISPECIES: SIS domain-containing protein [unclassified Planococcus (in: firmicutes)]MBU9673798.1 SIS domain-containing protein [Planococcus sp. CP5-4_YE]MBV0908926.1 SIS domain-containing protein [Planococcus sp. CP5-4_UN]MBW6063975.1 SIS domain-containing protein [Planococcus sp. CP5-4]
MLTAYFEKIKEKLQAIEACEKENMAEAARKVAEAIKQGNIVQLFGCGHSHILTEEVFFRAGGLVPIKPILIEPLMLHEGAVTSSQLERQPDYAASFLAEQDFRPGDVLIVLSTSGRNPVPVDVAHHAREKGVYVIGLTSLAYSQSQPSRHSSGKHLYNSVDLAIDNHSVAGDAILSDAKVKVPFGPTSTVTGAAILNAVFAEAIALMAAEGFEPPVFLSGNIDGADGHNHRLVEKYRNRIPLLS